jgi:hypothetical protein
VFPLADWLLGSLVPAAAHHPVNATREERIRYQTVRKAAAVPD